MKSLDVANLLISRYGGRYEMTNLKLNKLAYFAQAVCLRQHDKPLFDDEIQAWAYGPVEPMVYHAFSSYGSDVIHAPQDKAECPPLVEQVVDKVMSAYGPLTAFDLVRLSHRDGSAWKHAYRADANETITPDMIMASTDGITENVMSGTLAENVQMVRQTWPNALRMLEDS